jgi:[ribosomal protein S5]-alanine N-acetyltransferase
VSAPGSSSLVLQQGSRVFLRAPAARDAGEFTSLNRRSRRQHTGWVSPPVTAAQFAAYLDRCAANDFEGLLVCRGDDGAIVGAVNLSQIFHGPFQSCYMGFQVGAPFARQGFMAEALPLALRHAFRTLKLHRVEANIQPGNAASIALVRKTGFRLEGYSPRYLKVGGRWRDHERWAILREEWPRALSRDDDRNSAHVWSASFRRESPARESP